MLIIHSMVRTRLVVGALLLGGLLLVAGQSITCSREQKCGRGKPCCSQYGQCGTGAFCLGGCDPRASFSLDACVPAPVCQDKTYRWDEARVVDIGEYLGDATGHDWVSQGYPLRHGDTMLLTMPPHSGGTVMTTTHYVWYGTIRARLRTGRGAGVVTAFILYSDVKDEIDFEFVGADLGTAQTNFYFQGMPDYSKSENVSVTESFAEVHEYEIEWRPDLIRWSVDGREGRIKRKVDTFNATTNQYEYPQTPSRLQLSIWPGGNATNPPGTIAWAGGPINWDSADVQDYGYDFATVAKVEVRCHDAARRGDPGSHAGTSYVYADEAVIEASVRDSDQPTVLRSLAGTGLDMHADADGDGADTSDGSVPKSSFAGPGQKPGVVVSDGDGDGTDRDGGSQLQCESFCQGTSTASRRNPSIGVRVAESRTGASAFAVVVGFAVLLLV